MIKKFFLVFSLIAVLFFHSVPVFSVHAINSPNTIDYEVATGITLTELFNDYNLVLNSDFSNGDTNWVGNTAKVNDGMYKQTNNSDHLQQDISSPISGNIIFAVAKNVQYNTVNYLSTGTLGFYLGLFDYNNYNNAKATFHNDYGAYKILTSNGVRIMLSAYSAPSENNIYYDDIYAMNLSTIFGAGNEPSISTMFNYYKDYKEYILYKNGYDIGYDIGYDTGFNATPFQDINLDGFDDNSFLAGINQYMSDSLIKPLLYSPLNYTFMIGFFIYLSLVFISLTFKNRITFAVAGLFYFVPLTIFISDTWISLLSIIAIIFHITFAFFHNTDKEETI